MTNFQIARDLVLLVLGGVGTGLSIYNLFELRGRGLRRVRVFANTVMHTYEDGRIGPPFLKVMATNTGHRDVTLANLGIELPGKKTVMTLNANSFYGDLDTRLPVKLSDGALAHRYYPYSDITGLIKSERLGRRPKLKPFVDDTSGKRHYGKTIKWDS